MSTAADLCRYCNSPRLLTVRCEVGPHYARTSCRDCNRFLRWEPAPMTYARACLYPLLFGKFVGWTLGRVGETSGGRGYLEWMAATCDLKPGLARAIDCYLAGEDGKRDD
jgi:hypothetical protein